MQRVVEPELMNDVAQAAAYADADFSTTDAEWIERYVALFGPPEGEVIDLGCGPGNLSFRLSQVGRRCRVLAVDGSMAMLSIAEERRSAGWPGSERVRFRCAVLPDPSLVPAAFDGLVSNSLLHHLHDPAVLWQTIRTIGRPGAAVLIADLRRPPHATTAQELTERYAADAPEVLRRDFHASLHAAFEVSEVRAQLRAAGLDTLDVTAVGDRHLLVWGRLPADR